MRGKHSMQRSTVHEMSSMTCVWNIHVIHLEDRVSRI